MKPELLLLPITTAALVLVSGCRSHCPAGTHSCSGAAAPAIATATPPAVVPAPAPSQPLPAPLRIKAGGGAVKDATGLEWQADTGFTGGDVIERPELQIANTQQPEVYRSEHYAMDAFSQKLPNGKYQVKLHFCETFEGIAGPGERVFTFEVEGQTFKDFDVWVKSGGAARAYVETVDVNITDGQLDIKFTPQVENPQINGIEIIPGR